MKKLLPIALLLAFVGCDSEDPTPKFTMTAVNDTGLPLQLKCAGCTTITLAIDDSLTFGSDHAFADYEIVAEQGATPKTIEFKEERGSKYRITAYYWKIQYRVTATSTTAEVTLINGEGGTSQYTVTKTAANYQFKEFSGNLAQVSAKVTGNSGTVGVYLFYKDRRIKDDIVNGVGETATVSATIE